MKVDEDLLANLLSQYPMAVSVSPNGERFLLKARLQHDFEILVVDRASQEIIASDRSPDTQLSLTWRPDGQAIAFQESPGGNRQYCLYLFDLTTGERRRLNSPITGTAALPLRWNSTGQKLAYFQTTDREEGNILILDMTNESLSPVLALDSVARDGDFVWSPNGQQIAAVSAGGGATVMLVNLKTFDRKEFVVDPRGKLGHLAWAPDGKSILATARMTGSEFFQLFEVELENSRVVPRATHTGDISSPIWLPDGRSFIYHLTERGNRVPFVGFQDGSRSRGLGFTNGVNQIQTVMPHGRYAFMLAKSPITPPSLYEIDLQTSDTKPKLLKSPPFSNDIAAIPPDLIELKSEDGRSIPTLVWRSPTGPPVNFVLIEVHAGPRIQSTPEWDAAKQFFLRKGIHILAVDYRGSSGYGVSFERTTDQAGQIEDIVAACDYAANHLRAPKRGLVLLGSSYGSTLVLGASDKRGDLLAGVILTALSEVPKVTGDRLSTRFRVFGFHGKNDRILPPSQARKAVERYLGSRCLVSPQGHWEVFVDEGHHFHRTLSWAKVYSAVLESFTQTNAQPSPKKQRL